MLDAVARYRLDNVAFELLRSKVRKRFRKGIVESVSKHDNELQEQWCISNWDPFMTLTREVSRRTQGATRQTATDAAHANEA